MAGRSKWANIKHRKGAQDAKRGKIFTRLIREIAIAEKLGGADLAAYLFNQLGMISYAIGAADISEAVLARLSEQSH